MLGAWAKVAPVVVSLVVLQGCMVAGSPRCMVPAAVPVQSAAVLDFSMAPRVVERRDPCTRQMRYFAKPVETEKDIRGWWFGSQDVYYNANMGRIAADLFAEVLQECGVYSIYSRRDLRSYYVSKAETLREQLNLREEQLNQALLQLNPCAIGRELGVDKVVVGHICDSETRANRASGKFCSAISFSVSVYDVASGRLEFTREYGGVTPRSSQYTAFETEARRFVTELRTQHLKR